MPNAGRNPREECSRRECTGRSEEQRRLGRLYRRSKCLSATFISKMTVTATVCFYRFVALTAFMTDRVRSFILWRVNTSETVLISSSIFVKGIAAQACKWLKSTKIGDLKTICSRLKSWCESASMGRLWLRRSHHTCRRSKRRMLSAILVIAFSHL